MINEMGAEKYFEHVDANASSYLLASHIKNCTKTMADGLIPFPFQEILIRLIRIPPTSPFLIFRE